MNIEKYISTRKSVVSGDIYVARYEKMFEDIHKGNSELRLKVIKSLNKQTEILLEGKNKILIYDQYLGQTINDLNYIFFHATSRDSGLSFVSRLLAESFYLRGMYEPCLYFLEIHFTFANKLDLGSQFQKHQKLFTEIQEMFILAHEIGHEVYSVSGDHNLLSSTRALFQKDQVESYRTKETIKIDFNGSYAKSILGSLGLGQEHYETVKNQLDEKFGQKEYFKFVESMEALCYKNEFLEELISDDMGTKFVFKMKHASSSTIARSINLVLLYLRMLGTIEGMINDLVSSTNTLTDFFTESLARLSFMRKMLVRNVFIEKGQEMATQLEKLMISDHERFTTMIADELIVTLQSDLNDLKREIPGIFTKSYSFSEIIKHQIKIKDYLL